jgi:hypothetical protein
MAMVPAEWGYEVRSKPGEKEEAQNDRECGVARWSGIGSGTSEDG